METEPPAETANPKLRGWGQSLQGASRPFVAGHDLQRVEGPPPQEEKSELNSENEQPPDCQDIAVSLGVM